ncbi:unnamed protein product [Linum tenue]|uniref:Uncharacterized protein n=1 Tax=Linum tenue TaxID=586396 RepID=A0AAV0J083_9ROSI|nr:unnamed protein product [Linum tenue]
MFISYNKHKYFKFLAPLLP